MQVICQLAAVVFTTRKFKTLCSMCSYVKISFTLKFLHRKQTNLQIKLY